MKLTCATCGETMRATTCESTLVGFISPAGHDHDDNCLTSVYVCSKGHTERVSVQRTCSVCDWRGKLTCFCHPGVKLAEWPE